MSDSKELEELVKGVAWAAADNTGKESCWCPDWVCPMIEGHDPKCEAIMDYFNRKGDVK